MSINEQAWVVLKFGGTSVATAVNWAMIATVIKKRREQGKRVLIVHSAITGISNLLESIACCQQRQDFSETVQQIESRHRQLAREMAVDVDAILHAEFTELRELAAGIGLLGEASAKAHARLMALGELMATRLGAAFLLTQNIEAHWLDARTVLQSEAARYASSTSQFISAQCPFTFDQNARNTVDSLSDVVLTQGFIARNDKGDTVILGRGGSDTSGAYLGAKIGAERVEIWTDVPGMFTANPRAITGARVLKALAYDEAQEIAATGAKVLHPRCIAPVQDAQIPMWVMCTHTPDLPGTIISNTAPRRAQIKAISVKKHLTLVNMASSGMWQQVGFLADVFACFKTLGLSVDLVSTSESTLSVTLDPGANTIDSGTLTTLTQNLSAYCTPTIVQNCAAVSLVGRDLRRLLPSLKPMLDLLAEHELHMLTQAANDLNFSVVLDNAHADRLAVQLHKLLIGQEDDVLGPTWEALQH